jgi:hypothetical protein
MVDILALQNEIDALKQNLALAMELIDYKSILIRELEQENTRLSEENDRFQKLEFAEAMDL